MNSLLEYIARVTLGSGFELIGHQIGFRSDGTLFWCTEVMSDIKTSSTTTRRAQTRMRPLFCCHDLDLEPTIVKLIHDIDILKMYLQTKNEVARSVHSKLIA